MAAGGELMHELSLSRALLASALRHARGRRVLRVDVTVGALRQVVPDNLAFYFEVVARGTPCEGATLVTALLPARLACPCGHEWELASPSFRCPRCGGTETRVLGGEELRLESIEVDDDEPQHATGVSTGAQAASRSAAARSSSTSAGSAASTSPESPMPASKLRPSIP